MGGVEHTISIDNDVAKISGAKVLYQICTQEMV